MLSKAIFKSILESKKRIAQSRFNAIKIIFEELENKKSIPFTNQGIKQIKKIFKNNGFHAYYRKSDGAHAFRFHVYSIFNSVREEKIKALKLCDFPVIIKHEKFYFKSTCQFMTKELNSSHVDLNIKKNDFVNFEHHWAMYERHEEEKKTFETLLDLSMIENETSICKKGCFNEK